MPARPREKPNKPHLAMIIVAVTATLLIAWVTASQVSKDATLGRNALQQVKDLVALGPRPSGSEAHKKMEQMIVERLQAAGLNPDQDRFTAEGPNGPLLMNNIIARMKGRDQRILILATHYDTKLERNFPFVGANDGGSGTGLLLAMAPLLAKRSFNHSVWLVFLDGEESIPQEWSDKDSLFGSRHLAAELTANGTVRQVGAFILLDMIGDADLHILKDSNSTPWLRDLVWSVAAKLGDSRYFDGPPNSIEDDHIPLVQAGVPSVDLIDLDYGPNGSYWHTAQDTVDKLSAQTLQAVGDVAQAALAELDKK